ncbi:hypothetical protein CspHIS471_0701760 [Cutaneotrichosporon sp. HIS471]|nr:hypothetical protein CspHIS471_0701760 [Cutaneotrichosporon sp. HIS471]
MLVARVSKSRFGRSTSQMLSDIAWWLTRSPFLFNLFAEAFHWVLESRSVSDSHYLDDSFGAEISDKVQPTVDLVLATSSSLGLKVAPHKVEFGPRVEILGVLVDAEPGTASSTSTCRDRIVHSINEVLDRGSCRPRALAAITGSLVFVTCVCPPGRPFLRRIYDAVSPDPSAFHRVHRVPGPVRRDLI